MPSVSASSSLLPALAEPWWPYWQAAGFFLATFVLEDVAAVGAGLLLASGQMSWPAAFAACFLGIWWGDVGLYILARVGGRRWFETSRLRRYAPAVDRSERWFTRHGTPLLVFSRMFPGARLPTYLAAGFLRVPWSRFLIVTGLASCVWTYIVLSLTQLFGSDLLDTLKSHQEKGLLILVGGVLAVGLLQWLRGRMARFDWRAIARLKYWEFWPSWMFYPPVAVYYGWLALKYRGLALPTAANPGIFTGGMVGESKIDLLTKLSVSSPQFTAPASLLRAQDRPAALADFEGLRKQLGLEYPFILKPDIGQRGIGVKLIRSRSQAEDYLRQTCTDLVAQRYAPGPGEVGIFYYRFPHEPRGRIFAITEKIFPYVVGDGLSTVAELIHQDARAKWIADKYLVRLESRRNEVLPNGERLKLVEAGNHAQGCIFQDGKRLWTPELEACIDEISRGIDGFFIGRYDIRFSDETDLRAGRSFQIIELNGAASEATSIYDARNSLWSAYRTLFHQWNLVFAIGSANRSRGFAPTGLWTLGQAWRAYAKQAAHYPIAD